MLKEYLYWASNMGKCTLYFSIRAALFNVIIHLDFEVNRMVFIENYKSSSVSRIHTNPFSRAHN